MTTSTPTLPAARRSEQPFELRDADWSAYEGFLEALGDRPVRVTYDRGRLEIMTLSARHECFSHLIARLVDTLTEELGRSVRNVGSTTFKRKDLDRGLEGDQCYYLDEHVELVREKDEIDLDVDPPPDLALEIDVSRSSLNRLGIYAAMRVPEVRRFDEEALIVYHLTELGNYEELRRSQYFPDVPIQKLVRFLKMRTATDDNSIIRAFRTWFREQIARGWKVE